MLERSPGKEPFLHQLSPSSWESRGDRKRGVSESGRECETTPLVFQQYASLFNTYNMRFDMTRSVQRSYTRLHDATVMPNLSLTRRPPTLSSRDVRLENSTRLREREAGLTENTTHYNRRLIYCIAIPRQHKDQNIAGWSWLGCRQTAQLVTNRCLKMVTDLYTVGSSCLPAD